MAKAAFLDRDGTLNIDPGYIRHPDELKIYDHTGPALAELQRAGFELVVVTNQSGVGRGLIQEDDLVEIHARLNELLRPWSVQIDHFKYCPLLPDSKNNRRKPKPTLLLEAANELNLKIENSIMVGDRVTDLLAGQAAGCRAVALVRTGLGVEAEKDPQSQIADFIGNDLLEVANWIGTLP